MHNTQEIGDELSSLLGPVQARELALGLLNKDPIAIVSTACRFPAGVNDLESYWRFTTSGGDAVGEVSPKRWAVEPFFDPKPGVPDRTYSRWAALLDDVRGFEPSFFGIAPTDAVRTDPQQRLVLELCWEALERAGSTSQTLSASRTGVFIGAFSHDWFDLQHAGKPYCDAAATLGTQFGLLAARVSYWLNLRGPALVVETACSSSLVALHLACESLRRGECDAALAGGVQLLLTPRQQIACSQLRMLSPRGRCHAFDDNADGIVLGEGGGVVVLKRLSDALRARDPVVALLKASAVNHDGRTLGLSAPNPEAQKQVMNTAVAAAGIEVEDVGYFEAHGTGTAIGDPAELESIQSVFGQGKKTCFVGSSKANFGHTIAASGMAALFRALGVLNTGVVPQQLHLSRVNRRFDLSDTRFEIAMAPTSHETRLVALSNFGNSGTNAHAILERAPTRPSATRSWQGPWVYAVSAPEEASQSDALQRHAAHLATTALDMPDLAYSASARRQQQRLRSVVVADTPEQARARLCDQLERKSWVLSGQHTSIVWLFPGHGAQQPGMGSGLIEFAESLEALEQVAEPLRRDAGFDLVQALRTGSLQPPLDQELVEFAFQVGFARLLNAWGCAPDVVLGHGMGEVAAAYAAHLLDAKACVRVMLERRRVLADVADPGAATRLRHALGDLRPEAAPRARFVSSLGGAHPAQRIADAEYWAENLRQPVEFLRASREALAHAGHKPLVIEVAPRGVLLRSFCEMAKSLGQEVTSICLQPAISERHALVSVAAELHAHGVDVSQNLPGSKEGVVVDLPTHPWQRREYWLLPQALEQAHVSLLSTKELEMFREHRIGGAPAVPGTALLDVICQARACRRLTQVRFERLCSLALERELALETRWLGETSEVHGTGARLLTACAAEVVPLQDCEPLAVVKARCGRSVDPSWLYQTYLERHGVDYGPSFRCVRALALGTREVLAEVEIADAALREFAGAVFHPVGLDACLHAAGVLLLEQTGDTGILPVSMQAIQIESPLPARVIVHARLTASDTFDLSLRDVDGRPIGEVRGFVVAGAERAPRLLTPEWREIPWKHQPDTGSWRCLGTHAADVARALSASGRNVSAGPAPRVIVAELAVGELGVPFVLARLFYSVRCALADGARAVTFITRGAAMPPLTEPLLGASWGLANALALEYPDVRWSCVDVGSLRDIELWAERSVEPLEDRVAIRDGRAFGWRWRESLNGAESIDWSSLDSVVLSGGTGGIGAELADELLARGVSRVVTLGRSPHRHGDPRKLHLQVDVSDLAAVTRAFADLRSAGHELHGIVHCAGMAAEAAFLEHDTASYELVTAAKVGGAQNLAEVSQNDRLRFFLLASSLSSAFGAEGQSGYAAANGIIDALAVSLRERGIPATACAFGPWARTGMLRERPALEGRLAQLGVPAMQPRAAAKATLALLGGPSVRVALTHFEIDKWFAAFPEQRPRVCWSELGNGSTILPRSLPDFGNLAGPERRTLVEALVRSALEEVLHVGAAELDQEKSLLDLGLSSLTALDLRDQLENRVGVRIPSTTLWKQPSVAAVVQALLERLPAALTEPRETETVLSELDDASVSEALIKELAELDG